MIINVTLSAPPTNANIVEPNTSINNDTHTHTHTLKKVNTMFRKRNNGSKSEEKEKC